MMNQKNLNEKHLNKSNYNLVMMNQANLKKMTKSQLIELLLKNQQKPIPKPRIQSKRPVAIPRRRVKQIVKDYEQNVITSDVKSKDDYKPVPKPRTIKSKPIPTPRKKII